MAINTKKFLPVSSSSSAIVRRVKSKDIAKNIKSNTNEDINYVNVRLIDIDNILKKNLLLQEKSFKNQKKQDEVTESEKKEEKLEEKKEKKSKFKFPVNIPSMGILDRINRFITFTLLGWVVNKLFKYLPQLLEFSKNIGPVIDFVEKFAGNIFNGIVNFIDFGYKAYDTVRNFTKTIGGEPFQKAFDDFSKNLNTFVNLAIIAGLAAIGGTDFGLGRKSKTDSVSNLKGRPKVTTSGGAPVGGPNIKNPLRKRPTVTTSGGKLAQKAAFKSLKPLMGRIPLIGGLIEFGLSWALGDPIGKAAFRGIGAFLIGAIGTAIGGPIGAALGSWVGGEAGGALYDVIFENKKKVKGPKQPEIKAKAKGGKITTRKGKVVGGAIKRSLRKTLPSPKVKAIIPGSSVGGEKELKKIFPEPQGSQIGKTVNPFGFLKSTTESMGQVPFLGPLFSLFGKVLLGQIPTKDDYSNIGIGINAWINNAIGRGFLIGNVMKGFNRGGLIDFETEMRQNISGWVEKSVEELVKNKVTEAINELRKNLGMEPLSTGTEGNLEGAPAGEGTSQISGGLSGIDKGVVLAQMLMHDLGISAEAAAGIAGNLYFESSGLTPGEREGAPYGVSESPWPLGTKRKGYGWAQWTGGRMDNFVKFYGGQNGKIATDQDNYNFLLHEIKTVEPISGIPQNDPIAAANWFRKNWERAGIPHDAQRQRDTMAIFEKLKKEGKGSRVGTGWTKAMLPQDVAIGNQRGSLNSIKELGNVMGLNITSTYRSGDRGYHGSGRAIDFQTPGKSGNRGTPQQMEFAKEVIKRYGSSITELIYTPLGFGIKNGKKVPLTTWGPISPPWADLPDGHPLKNSTNAIHYDHVHVAFEDGGIIPNNNKINPIKKTPSIKPLKTQTSYEESSETIMIIQPIIVEKITPVNKNKKSINFSGGGVNSNNKISQLSIR
jgi:hypothetical protein